MSKRKIFNVAYFIASIGVFAWLLRGEPHWRMLPIVSVLMGGIYGLMALVAVFKPNGFAVTHEVLSLEQQRRYRQWALLIPIPAMVYALLYSACVQFAGEAPCLNKFYGPIAKIERAAFSRSRMIDFYHKTHNRLLGAALNSEGEEDWAKTESYYRAVTALENRLCHKKRPSSYAIMACVYQRMGDPAKAEKYFLEAERLANKHCKYHQRVCKHGEIISIGHALKELDKLGDIDIAIDHPWLSPYVYLKDAPAAVLGRRFLSLEDIDPIRRKHDHAWCTSQSCSKISSHKDDQCKDDSCEHPGACLTHGLFGKLKHDCNKEGCKDECKEHKLLIQLCPSHKCKDKECEQDTIRLYNAKCKDEDCNNEEHADQVTLQSLYTLDFNEKDQEGNPLRYPQFDAIPLKSL